MQENTLRTTYKLLFKTKNIRQYALIETLLMLPLLILIAGGLGIFIINGFSIEDAVMSVLSHIPILFAATSLLLLTIVSTPLHFYLQFRFKIAAMFNAYDMLSHRPTSFISGWEQSKGKPWLLFIIRYKAKFAGLRLSLKQLRDIRKTGKPPDGGFMLHDDFFVGPIVLFEKKTPEEAIKESAKLYTRDFWKLQQSEIGFEIVMPVLIFLTTTSLLIGTIVVSLRFPLFIITVPVVLLLWFAVVPFWGLLHSYTRVLFLVVLYVFAKQNKMPSSFT